MPRKMTPQKQVAQWRKFMLDNLLPDTCKIHVPQTSTGATDAFGVPTVGTLTYLTYDGSEDIPSRFDLKMAFHPDRLKAQNKTIDEFDVELPADLEGVVEGCFLIWKGKRFVIRKLKDVAEYDISLVVYAMAVE